MNQSANLSGPDSSKRLAAARKLRRWLLVLAVVPTVTAAFYTVENWRGARAWERCKEESTKRGLNLDWNALIPPPVADDQNFFKAPNMQKWFTGRGGTDFSRRIDYGKLNEFRLQHGLLPTVEVAVVPAKTPITPGSADLVLQYDPPLLSLANPPADSTAKHAPNQKQGKVEISSAVVEQMFKTITPPLDSAKQNDQLPKLTEILGPTVVIDAASLDSGPTRRIVVRTDRAVSINDVEDFIPGRLKSGLGAIATGSNSYRVALGSPSNVPATDYLAWSDSFQDDFAALHAALQRPYARMDGDYEHPASVPIPNFISTRAVAQMLSFRTQCYLLKGEPDKALRELTQLNDLCRLLEGRPTGQPMTLVAAMINAAVRGLYVSIIGDGFRLHAWQEPQLAAIEQQLAAIDLPVYLHSALRVEAVGNGRMAESRNPAELADAYHGPSTLGFWGKLRDPLRLYFQLAPHGWLLQNAVRSTRLEQAMAATVDPTNHLVRPTEVVVQFREIENLTRHQTPYNYLASHFIPNYFHAVQTLAKNQTLINEALVACALERYRLARGNYPETPDALVPQFAERLPNDLIGGKPLKYRFTNGSYVLYSIGWNETDEGGVPCWAGDLSGDMNKNDWVWPYQETGVK